MSKRGRKPARVDPSHLEWIERVCMLGARDEELARFLGVCVATVCNLMLNDEKFAAAVKNGREYADAMVAASLYRKAIGYTHEIEKVVVVGGIPTKMNVMEKFPPDTGAICMWLKNRRPDLWRDSIPVTEAVNAINSTIERELERLAARREAPTPRDNPSTAIN